MNWKAATLALVFVTVSVSVSASSPQLFLDRLTEDPVNQTYLNDSIRFTTGHLNQTATYQNALIPESLQDDLKKWLVKSKTVNGSLTELQVQYEFDQNTTLTPLDGEKFDAKISFNTSVTEADYKTKGGKIEVQAWVHYEHLVFNYSVYNATTEPRRVVASYERVVSGIEPEKLPFTASVERLNESYVEQTLTYDNLYGPQEQKVLALVYEPGAAVASIDTGNATRTACSLGYTSYVRPRLNDANVSHVLPGIQDLQYACYNVSIPADSTVNITTVFDENAIETVGNTLTMTDRTYRTYLAGSGGSLLVNSTQELCGDVTNSTGGTYDSINISGTATVCPYNGTSWTGTVNLTANHWISISGTVNGNALGYNHSEGPSPGVDVAAGGPDGAGGGAYGGVGGNGTSSTWGHPAYGNTSFTDILMGSGGGDSLPDGGSGGAAIYLQAPYVRTSGSVTANGEKPPDPSDTSGGAGGGAGGGVFVKAYSAVMNSTSVSVDGGQGGDYNTDACNCHPGGGGGAGGRIKLLFEDLFWNNSATFSRSGGAGGNGAQPEYNGEPGANGTYTKDKRDLGLVQPQAEWLDNRSHPFHVAQNGVTLDQSYTGVRSLEINETDGLKWVNLRTVDAAKIPYQCSLTNNSAVTLPANAIRNYTLGFSCTPGTEGEPSLTLLDSGDTVTAWYNTTDMQIYTNLTENTPITWPIPGSVLDNVGDRKAGSLSAIVDGSSKNVTVHDHGSTFHVHIGREHTNSSMHAVGDHVAGLTYQYSTGTGSSQQSGGGGGGGSSGGNETTELLVKFEPRDTYQVPINHSETIEFVVKNLATRKNTVTLTALPDQSTGCQYITLDRTEVELLPKDKGLTGEFYRDRIGVELRMPSEDVIETSGGRIHCVYSADATHGEAEKLVITAVPDTGFFAGLNDLFQRLLGATLISETTQCLSVDECAPGDRTTLPIPGAVGWVLIVLLLGSGVFLARR